MRTRFGKTEKVSNKYLSIIIGLWIAWLVIILWPSLTLAQGPIEVQEQTLIANLDPTGAVQHAVSGDIVVLNAWGDGIYSHNLSAGGPWSLIRHHSTARHPDVSGNIIVWAELHNGYYDIYAYDLSQPPSLPIASRAAHQTRPAIDGEIVVWVDWRNGGSDYYGNDIYGCNLKTGSDFRVTNAAAAEICCPDISGQTVVWSDRRNGTWQVYAKNLVSQSEIPLPGIGDATDPLMPVISGNVIVVGLDQTIYGFNSFGRPLFEVDGEWGRLGPMAMDGDLVVWQEEPEICIPDPCLPRIFGYDLTTGYKFPISSNEYEARFPKISDDVVVWQGSQPYPLLPDFRGLYASRLLQTVQPTVSSQFVDVGDILTYTITLAEVSSAGLQKSITNRLSPLTTLDPDSLSATVGNPDYLPGTHTITWGGNVSSATPVTITYCAQVSPATVKGEHIVNTIVISDQTDIFTRTLDSWVAYRTYLPVILHN